MPPLRIHRKAVAELRKATRDYGRIDPQLARDFTESYGELPAILVVAHNSRAPDYWEARIDDV